MGDRIIVSNNRYFPRLQNSIIYTEGEGGFYDTIFNIVPHELVIMVQSNVGKIQPYSKYVSRLQRCIACVSKNTAVVDNGFTHRLWHNNLKYIAYEDGVYSFVEYRLLSIVEAYKAQIFFTCYIARLFPHTNNEAHEDLFSQTFSFCEIARPFPPTMRHQKRYSAVLSNLSCLTTNSACFS